MTDRKVFEAYGFNTFPREMGVSLMNYQHQPMHRFAVKSMSELTKWSQTFTEKKQHAIFIEHNARTKTQTHKNILLANMFFDFDGKIHGVFTDANTDRALKDLAHWYDYFESAYDHPPDRILSFSGSGGHGILKLTPQMVNLEINDLGFHPVLEEFQTEIKKKLNLTTLDPKVTEPLKLLRLPNTPYVYMDRSKKQYVQTDRYCIPITREVLDWHIQDVLALSRSNSSQYVEPQTGVRFDASELIQAAKIRSEEKKQAQILPVAGEINWVSMPFKMFYSTLQEIFQFHKSIPIFQRLFLEDEESKRHKHPVHDTNLVSAIILRTHGLSANATKQIFSRISLVAGWDNRDLDKQAFYIDQIYTAQYAVPSI